MQEMSEKATKTWVMALTSVASFMVALDALVVTTALSTIRVDLGASKRKRLNRRSLIRTLLTSLRNERGWMSRASATLLLPSALMDRSDSAEAGGRFGRSDDASNLELHVYYSWPGRASHAAEIAPRGKLPVPSERHD